VGVFVDASLAAILEKANEFGLDAIQLHGNESPAFCAQLKKLMLTPGDRSVKSTAGPGTGGGSEGKVPLVIKVFSIKDRFNFAILTPYEAVCDYYLFDTKGKLPGGNGYTFNWKVLDKYPSEKPYFLSGGIGPESVEKLGHFLKSKTSQYCYAIDVNSAFEIEPGLKDTEKLRIFKGSLQTGHGPIHNP
jgi:phosphoribosylanthranilate isomerase